MDLLGPPKIQFAANIVEQYLRHVTALQNELQENLGHGVDLPDRVKSEAMVCTYLHNHLAHEVRSEAIHVRLEREFAEKYIAALKWAKLSIEHRLKEKLAEGLTAEMLQPLEKKRAELEGILQNPFLQEEGKDIEPLTLADPKSRLKKGSATSKDVVSVVIQGNVTGSQILTAGAGSSQSVQITDGSKANLKKLVAAIRADFNKLGLPGEDEAALKADVDTLDAQLSSPRPKTSVIEESKLSIRTILENATGTILAAGLIKLMGG